MPQTKLFRSRHGNNSIFHAAQIQCLDLRGSLNLMFGAKTQSFESPGSQLLEGQKWLYCKHQKYTQGSSRVWENKIWSKIVWLLQKIFALMRNCQKLKLDSQELKIFMNVAKDAFSIWWHKNLFWDYIYKTATAWFLKITLTPFSL